MDKDSQSEVTDRLRSAIKKKLSEISDIVDDELPEYIMILVANQRSKLQIEKDLSLFLRDDTVNFTNWLWNLLNSINIGSNSKNMNDSNVPKKKESDLDEDAVVIDYYPDEHENELLSQEDTNDGISNKAVAYQLAKDSSDEVKKLVVKTIQNHPPDDSNALTKEKTFEKRFHKKNVYEIKKPKSEVKRYSKELLSSKIVSVKKRYTNPDEYDPSEPELMKSAPRNYSGSAAFQANKLLLRAVDDAAKSILDGRNIEDFYKPTPIKVLTSKQFQKNIPDTNIEEEENSSDFVENTDILPDIPEINHQFIYTKSDKLEFPISSTKGRTICVRNLPTISDSSDSRQLDLDYDAEEVKPKSPHFIVTMEGINLNSFKRKLDDNSIDGIEDEEMEVDDYAEDISPNKKVKVAEKCKYWPACKNSDNCFYHHPTTPCKCFPECKFGDKCLYIHPNCKFDARCSRKDCPFTHASKRKLPLTIPPVKKIPVKSRRPNVLCKYHPKCNARSCPYIHPKLCRYGSECRSPICSFSHLPIPSRSQLKWQAPDL